jgi:hypothetical protein
MSSWEDNSAMNLIVLKLKKLKEVVVSWKKERRKLLQVEYINLEQMLDKIVQRFPSHIFPPEIKEEVLSLEKRKVELLKFEEESWRLKSRAIWLKSGDKNTKFFHKFVENRRNFNTIWDVMDDEGNFHQSQEGIKATTHNYFSSLYRAKDREDTLTQLNVLKEIPRFFSDEESDDVGKHISLQEIERVIENMPKDKSLGLDGWTQELFHNFFDIMGTDLLNAIEESRLSGKVCGSLNSTFLNLIPKESKPSSFNEYKPIALCNFVYKVITKIIASRIKEKLASCISVEQFGFLKDRLISML